MTCAISSSYITYLSYSEGRTTIVAYKDRETGQWGQLDPSECSNSIALSMNQLHACVSGAVIARVPEPELPLLLMAAAISFAAVRIARINAIKI